MPGSNGPTVWRGSRMERRFISAEPARTTNSVCIVGVSTTSHIPAADSPYCRSRCRAVAVCCMAAPSRATCWNLVATFRNATCWRGIWNAWKSLAVSSKGEYLASGSSDQTIRLWDIAGGTCRSVLTGHARRVQALAFSPDDRILASASFDGTVKLWDCDPSNGFLSTIDFEPEGNLPWSNRIAISADLRYLAMLASDDEVRVHRLGDRAGWQIAGERPAIAASDSVRPRSAFGCEDRFGRKG